MAVVLNFTIEQSDNAKTLIFTETTGSYNALLNTDGWGTPNEATSDATDVTLTITTPGGTATEYDSVSLTGLASFPTNDPSISLEITTDDLNTGSDTKHADGVWTFKYTVVTGTTTYETEHKVFVSGDVRCCVYKKLAAIDVEDCDCDSTDKKYALEAFTFYMATIANAESGNEDKYDTLLAITEKLCSSDKCS